MSIASNFWIRAIPQTACSNNDNTKDIRGIVYYGSTPGTPNTTGYSYVDACVDEPLSKLVPHLALNAGQQQWSDLEQVSIVASTNVFLWALNGTSFHADWNNPTLLQMYNNNTNFTTANHVIRLDEADQWAYIIIQAENAVAHPFHLHGHDFYILGQGAGTFKSTDLLTTSNPTRRDVAMLLGSGYLVVAFKTDNPGAWLMHCHIGWHTDMGLALQFIEQYSAARQLINYDLLNSTCKAWATYVAAQAVEQPTYDDGI